MKIQVPSSRFLLSLIGIVIFLLFLCGRAAAQNVSNYTFSAFNGTFTQIQGVPGSVSPALSGGGLDDGWFNSKPIGFPFIYEGVAYTTFSASTNGWMTFGTALSNSATSNNLATGTPRPIIAPLWDDIALNSTGSFTYYLSGVAPNRIMTVEWLNERWSYLSAGVVIDFQVKLYENNRRIEFIYRPQPGTGNTENASIGLGGVVSNNFLSVNSLSTTATVSSVVETNNIFGVVSAGLTYRFDHYLTKPVITNITPLSGPYNTSVTINGSGFDAATTSNIVYFGATKAVVQSSTFSSLQVVLPAGATYEAITVITLSSHLSSNAANFFDPTFCGGAITNASFGAPVNNTIGVFTRKCAIVDIDGDGKSEMAATSNAGVTIFRNTSSVGIINGSSFAAGVTFPSSGQTGNVIFVDLDGDGKKDMITGDYDAAGQDSITIYRNTSITGVINASSFTFRVCFEAGAYPFVSAGDIDGDGKPEIIASNAQDNTISILKNNSTVGVLNTTSFSARVNYSAGVRPWTNAIMDVDGDGKLDIIVSNGSDNNVSVYRNIASAGIINAASLAPRVSFTTGTYPLTVTTGDIDGDGIQDVICSNANSNNFSTLRNTSTIGSISFAAKVDIANPNGNNHLDLGDLDGDGKIDVATCPNTSFTMVAAFKNTSTPGSVSFTSGGNWSTPNSSQYIAVADLDGDGKPEIITPNGAAANISIFQNLNSQFNQIAPLTILSTTSNCNDGTWKTYYDPLNPNHVLVAIKDNGNNLGTTTVSEYKDPTPGNYNGIRFLARHFKVTPTTQPSSSVQIRLFFTPAEFTALQAVDPSLLTPANLSVTKYDGPTEDGVYYPTDATSLTWYPQGSMLNSTMYSGYYLEFTISSFSEFWIHGGVGILPIELLNFTAETNGQNVLLNWSTASETNNDYFTIEKTQDGINFVSVCTVNGAGTSTSQNNYHTIDTNPFEGTSYYRLKQTDFNGQFTYSDFKSVEFTNEEHLFSVFPNPGNGNVNIFCPGNKDDIVSLEIVDAIGRTLEKKEVTINELEHNTLFFTQGIYSIMVTRGEKRFVRQLIVL